MYSYEENKEYKVIPDTEMGGAYGKVEIVQDCTSRKIFVKKTISNAHFMNNEVEVPLRYKDVIGIPQVFGVILKEDETEVYQEHAGLSILKIWKEPSYVMQLRDPLKLLG